MSRRSRRQSKNIPSSAEIQRLVEAEVSRRLALNALPDGATARPLNQDALFAQMSAQQAPAKQGTTMFSPGAPLKPSPGLVDPNGPRTFVFPTGYNISSQPRSTEGTSFDTLRNLAMLYDGIQLCEQVWLDTVAKLNLVIKPRPEIVAEQGQSSSNTKYADKIRKYTDILNYPDKYNGYDLKTWLRAAVRDQLQIDAVAIYIRKNKVGGVFSLELVDATSIKPLIDPRGRRPQPPYPAYQQFYYGVPDGWYTSDEMIYLKETPRTESIYGLSRIERIILRVNQALRKQNKDLARFTEGNIPPAILQPPNDGSQWTPEQLIAYQTTWDALLAGNDQARSRIKVVEPGSSIQPLEETDIFLDFDRFLLNVTTACYSMTMADLGFTESVNKSSGDSQENVFYRRAVQPLMDRYSQLFTQILRNYFDEQDLIVTWGGFEESEDFNAMATSYVALVGSGIISPTVAAQQMKLPTSGADIPVFVLVPGQGITFLEDAANPEMRKAANDAKKAGYEQASNPPPPAPEPGQTTDEPNGVGVPPGQGGDKSQSDDAQAAKDDEKPQDDKVNQAAPTKKSGVQRSTDSNAHTGMMIAFMLKEGVASQLALPGGEPTEQMHCTLAYLGDMNDLPGDDSLKPNTSPDLIKAALTLFAHETQPLQGKTSGIARFAASEHSDGSSPIVALVDAPGIQDFRNRLVMSIESAGYNVAKNFEYTPHVTLAYIPQDSPMPVKEVPSVSLIFDEICLAIGDDHSYFKLGQAPIEKSDDPSFFVQVVDNDDDERAYNPAEPRDDFGKWTSGGGDAAQAIADVMATTKAGKGSSKAGTAAKEAAAKAKAEKAEAAAKAKAEKAAATAKAKAEKQAAKDAAAKAKAEKAEAAAKAKAEKTAAKEAAAKAKVEKTAAKEAAAKAKVEKAEASAKAKAEKAAAKEAAAKAKAEKQATKEASAKAKADKAAAGTKTNTTTKTAQAKAAAAKAKADEEAKVAQSKADEEAKSAAAKEVAAQPQAEDSKAAKEAANKALASAQTAKSAAFEVLDEKSAAYKDAQAKAAMAKTPAEKAAAEKDLAEKATAYKEADAKAESAFNAVEAAKAEADWHNFGQKIETGSKPLNGKTTKTGSKSKAAKFAKKSMNWDEVLGTEGPKQDEADPHLEEKEKFIEENGGKEWLASLTPEENNALTAYSGIGYNYMQDHLRGIKEAPKLVQAGIKDATAALMRGKAPKDMVVLRATDDLEHNLIKGAGLNGEHYVAKGFSSTTIEEHPKSSFGSKIQHITVPKDSPGAYIKPVSHKDNESEWLLPPNAKFRVDSVSGDHAYLTYLGVHQRKS